jgi:hypothetical protein
MTLKDIEFIIHCLPKGKTKFFYFKDKYAIDLLKYFIGDGKSVAEIKRSRYQALLQKPVIKSIIAMAADGRVTPDLLDAHWPADTETFLLTLDRWGNFSQKKKRYGFKYNYYQTTTGEGNLVLQLNFSNKHNQPYRSLIKPVGDHPFEYDQHPICRRRGYHTLAWARLEIDLAGDFCLIEEIQNDWIRLAAQGRTTIERVMQGEDGPRTVQEERWISPGNYKNVKKYYHEVLRPYHAIWDEAVLSAVVWFLRTEIGVTRIFYHTEESGKVLKQIWGRSPPQSIYNRLPRKFLFQETDVLPDLFSKKATERIREKDLWFFLLEI